jgi:hypothetical protein
VRSAAELLDVDDPAWPLLLEGFERAAVTVDVVDAPADARSAAIESLQVTGRSYLGALAGNCALLRVDHGWLRILGAGGAGVGSVRETTDTLAGGDDAQYLIVALDVLGGRFAVNAGGLPGDAGELCYWGVDTLEWMPLGFGHSAFVDAALAGGLTDFYAPLRWDGWEDEVAAVRDDHGLSIFPFPFSVEGQDLGAASRRPAPMSELLAVYDDLAGQLAGVDGRFRLIVAD